LGDLAECSESDFQFVANFLSVCPRLIWSQLRRRVGWKMLLLSAAWDGYVLGAVVAFFSAAFLNQGAGSWARLIAVWTVWVTGAALSVVYSPAGQPNPWNLRGWAKAFIVAAGVAIALRVPLIGVLAGLSAVVVLRIVLWLVLSMPWVKVGVLQQPLSAETVSEQAHALQRGIWWRNARESLVAMILLALQAREILTTEDNFDRAGAAFLMAGLIFVIYFLHFHANSRPIPQGDTQAILQFHCRELKRQRGILRAVPFWYLMPFVPGMLIQIFSNSRGVSGLWAVAGVAVVFAIVWRLNLWGAALLDRQLQAATALQEKFQEA
jgi:hypothetical protein